MNRSPINPQASMDYYTVAAVFLLSILSAAAAAATAKKQQKKRVPPSPRSLPIIGHLHLLKKPLHHTIAKLACVHGPVMSLRFGSRLVLVVSSASAAEECFTTNDIALANRPNFLVYKYFGPNLGFSSYGPHWRNLRRIFTLEIFSSRRIQSFSGIRVAEVKHLVSRLHRDCGPRDFKKVELRTRLYVLVFNVMMRILTGKGYYGEGVQNTEEAKKFRRIMEDALALAGAVVVGDHLPWLRWMDLKGTEKKMAEWTRRRDAFLQALIDERRAMRTSRRDKGGGESEEEGTTSVVDVFLSLQEQQPGDFKDDLIAGSLMDLLLGGTETTMVTMEWAMSFLLNHPQAMKRARAEMDSRVGSCKMIEDSDVPHLTYLQGIINETLRLRPVAPLLVPHESLEDIVVDGYDIPRGTMLMVNLQGIHSDGKVWEDATKFMPERFLPTKDGGTVIKGCRYIPFGFGRRRCPGETFGVTEIGLALATLIQCFDWEKVGGVEVDMTEGDGLTIPKAVPLEVMCKTREEMLPLLS